MFVAPQAGGEEPGDGDDGEDGKRTGPPEHAGETGRPDHAGEQGPPDHSNGKAKGRTEGEG